MKRIVDLMALPLLLVTAATAAPLQDKTLVAWVAPANVAQRGGSALTLIDPAEHFDAIVFGEVAEGKWMAGSDFFRRSQQDQAGWPAESANDNALVQIAVCYGGNRITLFRNGKEYATHAMGQAQPFGDDAMVLLGLRYIGEMGEIGFFAGVIEEARIYDTALNAAQLAALAPNVASIPNPLACWTFEDGKADDVMKRFPATRLEGGARIQDGRLVLDGRGYLWAAKDAGAFEPESVNEPPFDNSVQPLFYKARSPRTGNMWDTWLYLHDGIYHLYYLANCRGQWQWDNISLARSPDGVHWKEDGRVLSKGRGVTWMGTGSTWKSPRFEQDGRFFMNFSEWKGPRQTIFFAESTNLVHWTRLGREYEFVQDERWYQKNGRWDCIWTLPRPGGGLYGYWTATPKPETGGRFGFGETLDGVTWKALAPPKVSGVGEGEVGAIERIGDKYYMMFGTGGSMATLLAERPGGPFAAAKKNLRLLAGHTYFARFFPTPDGLLVNHHSIARDGQVSFGTLKATRFDDEGTLRLSWWPGNEKLKSEAVEVMPPSVRSGETQMVALLETTFDAGRGLMLEGMLKLPAPGETKPVGLFLAQGDDSGTAILVHAGGITEFGPMRADGTGFKAEQRVDREWAFGATARFRLLLKGSLIEFYLDDLLMQCYSLPQKATGRIGLLTANDPAVVTDLQAWRPENPQPWPAATITAQAGPAVLKPETFRPYVEAFNRSDRETVTNHIPNGAAWDWMAKNVPLFECPDKDLEEIYYFRWWTYRKHIKQTPDGFIITEFLPQVSWSKKHNTINCPAGHHLYEGRWIRDPQYLDAYARFYFGQGGDPGGVSKVYGNWLTDGLYARYLVNADKALVSGLLGQLVENHEAWSRDGNPGDPWQRSRRLDSGLFWQIDSWDGGEFSIGGTGIRPMSNSYRYGDTLAMARIAELAGRKDLADRYQAEADQLRKLVQDQLWDPGAKFFKVLRHEKVPTNQYGNSAAENCEPGRLVKVRELFGYVPWYFNLPEPGRGYEEAWRQLTDPQGFLAPYGPTVAERRHPNFKINAAGCQWCGASWPFATAQTLTALANLLNNYRQDVLGKEAYFDLLKTYARSHRRNAKDGGVVPWIDESLNPDTGAWIPTGGDTPRGKDYNHSTYCDLIISGLVGLRPRADDTIEVNPLVPEGTWDYFCLDRVPYHGRLVTILYDKSGQRYGQGRGLQVLADGMRIAGSDSLQRVAGGLPKQCEK